MGEVVEFARPEPRKATLRGDAICIDCKHQWEAVVPEGTFRNLECPACTLYKGVLYGMIEPGEGNSRYVCCCGNDLYYILPVGFMCALCGNEK